LGLFKRKTQEAPAPAEPKRASYVPVTLSPGHGYINLTYAGKYVTPEQALRDAAVSACVRVLKTSAFMLPVDEVITQGTRRRPVQPSPIVASPSARVSRRAWIGQVVHSLVSDGNVYLDLVVPDPTAMRVVNAETVNPSKVRWSERDGVEVCFVNNKERALWPLGNLLHMPASAFLRPGCTIADSPVELARQSIGISLAAEEFGARFFGDGAHPSAIVFSDEDLDDGQAEKVKGSVLNAQRGTREVAVFGSGLRYQQIQIDPKDSQFIDLMRFEVEQACRFFGVPPAMVYAAMSGEAITYQNVSEADMQYLKYSLTPWLVDVEDMWSSLIARPRVVKFNADALLRMDPRRRHELYALRLNSKTISVNEIHDLEDEERVADPEFDKPGVPGGAVITPAVNPATPAQGNK
jgi:HK97 family phage portal protein